MPAARGTNGTPGTAMALPQDILEDLLNAQGEQIGIAQPLPAIKVMPAGAGKYEFDDTEDVVASFQGVILNTHANNVLWDKPYGSQTAEENEGPGCQSVDGKYGTPRIGFRHAALDGAAATALERIECTGCPYNQWSSKGLLPGSAAGKGKACTNQRKVYILVLNDDGTPARETPMELTLPPTSISNLDEYMSGLLNQHMPVQAVLSTFAQIRKTFGAFTVGVVTFSNTRPLTQGEFDVVLAKRGQYLTQMSPRSMPPEAVVTDATFTDDGHDEDDVLPF